MWAVRHAGAMHCLECQLYLPRWVQGRRMHTFDRWAPGRLQFCDSRPWQQQLCPLLQSCARSDLTQAPILEEAHPLLSDQAISACLGYRRPSPPQPLKNCKAYIVIRALR